MSDPAVGFDEQADGDNARFRQKYGQAAGCGTYGEPIRSGKCGCGKRDGRLRRSYRLHGEYAFVSECADRLAGKVIGDDRAVCHRAHDDPALRQFAVTVLIDDLDGMTDILVRHADHPEHMFVFSISE